MLSKPVQHHNFCHKISQKIIVIVIIAQGISQQYNQLRVASDGLMAENEEMRGNIMRRSGDESCEGDAKNDENREQRDAGNIMRMLVLLFFPMQSISYHNPPNSRDAEISESNAELAALQREAAELATELRVSRIEA